MSRRFLARHRQILFVGSGSSSEAELIGHLEADVGLGVERLVTATACAARVTSTAAPLDAIIISSSLSDGDGVDLCARLRQRGATLPILLFTEAADESDIVRGLDQGANDVITCPLRPAEALARLRAQIRAFEASEDAVLDIGPFQFRPARRLLHNVKTGERTRLTEKEAAVLKFLYRAQSPVPRTTLLHEVWGYHNGATTHTVETHIYRLRRKIEPDANRICLLVNEDGGYRLRLDRQSLPSRPFSEAAAPPAELSRIQMMNPTMMAV